MEAHGFRRPGKAFACKSYLFVLHFPRQGTDFRSHGHVLPPPHLKKGPGHQLVLMSWFVHARERFMTAP